MRWSRLIGREEILLQYVVGSLLLLLFRVELTFNRINEPEFSLLGDDDEIDGGKTALNDWIFDVGKDDDGKKEGNWIWFANKLTCEIPLLLSNDSDASKKLSMEIIGDEENESGTKIVFDTKVVFDEATDFPIGICNKEILSWVVDVMGSSIILILLFSKIEFGSNCDDAEVSRREKEPQDRMFRILLFTWQNEDDDDDDEKVEIDVVGEGSESTASNEHDDDVNDDVEEKLKVFPSM